MREFVRARTWAASWACASAIAALVTAGAFVQAPAAEAVAGDAVEFAFTVKTENNIQFGICTNIDEQTEFGAPFDGQIDLTLTVKRQDGSVVQDSGWGWQMIGTEWLGMPSRCRDFARIMQVVWPAWNSVSGLEPGTTYDFVAQLTATPVGGQPHVFTATQQATTGGGCPLGAPDDSLLRTSAWNGIGVDADGKAVITGMVIDPEAVPDWVTAQFPQAVQWVPEYLWTGKTLAQSGYYWDPVTQNFGPPVADGGSMPVGDVLALVDLAECAQSPQNDVVVIIDPTSATVCDATDTGALLGLDQGPCTFTVQVTSGAAPSGRAGPQVALSYSVRSLVMVRPAASGGGGGGGGSGGSGGGGASEAPSGTGSAAGSATTVPSVPAASVASTPATPEISTTPVQAPAVPVVSSITNPARPAHVMSGVTLVTAGQAAHVRPALVREPATTAARQAPRVEVAPDAVTRPVLTGLPPGVGATVQIGRGGAYSMLGRATITSGGRLTAPALRLSRPGTYTLRVTTRDRATYFVKLVVPAAA